MKYYIMTDIEGTSGVLDSQNWIYSTSMYKEKGKELLTRELMAVIAGLRRADADADITVVDGHGSGAINFEMLDEEVKYIGMRGLPYPFGLTKDFDAALWVGQHAKSGTVGSHLAHTGGFSILYTKINDTVCSEYIDVALCANELGVPVIFGGGEAAFIDELHDFSPNAVGVAGKRGLRQDSGDHLPEETYETYNWAAEHIHPVKVRKMLEEGAYQAATLLLTKGKSYFPYTNIPTAPYIRTVKTRSGIKMVSDKEYSTVIDVLNGKKKKVEE